MQLLKTFAFTGRGDVKVEHCENTSRGNGGIQLWSVEPRLAKGSLRWLRRLLASFTFPFFSVREERCLAILIVDAPYYLDTQHSAIYS